MKKSARLALALLVVAAGGAIAFAGAAPESFRTVAEVAAAPDAHAGKPLELKASVRAGSVARDGGAFAFVVEDGAARLPVTWTSPKPVPEHEAGGTIEGRIVVLRGTLERDESGGWFFAATDMQVGCASKYEPVPESPAPA